MTSQPFPQCLVTRRRTMAGASDPLEDMFFSEVDEKAVSDLVGSLESQLAGQSNQAGKTDENGGAGSVAPANHLLGKTLPAPVGTTTLEQQQGRGNKPEMRQEIKCKEVCPDKSTTPPSLGCTPSFGEPSTTSAPSVNAAGSGAQSHGASVTTLTAPGVSTLASPAASISTTSSRGSKVSPSSGTPTISLQRLPSHIVASITQNGNGASVTALVQQGAAAEPSSSPQETNSKPVSETGASKTDDCQSKIVMSSQSGSPPSCTTTTVCVTAPVTTTVCGHVTSVATTISLVRPAAPSPTPAVATSAQSQPRPGLTAPQRIVAPQLIVRPPQQQTTIQLPPGFTIPPGMVLVRTELGQLVMVPQQALAQVQAQAQNKNVKKCKNFLATLIKLASHNSPSPETSKNVKALVQDLLVSGTVLTWTQYCLNEFFSYLKRGFLPALRLSLLNSQQSLIQPPQQGVKPAPGGVPPAIVTGPGVRIRHPNSVSTTTGVRMPVVITQSVRAQGTIGKGAVIQAGRGAMGMAVQISGNQKNKLNDPGGGSFRDDDDINDVASMAGVNLNEESARILATNSELVGTQIRSCKDEAFLHPGLLHRRILETAKKFGVTDVPMEAVTFISHATQSRLRTVVEKVSTIAQHRLDSCKDDEYYEQNADVRSQLRFFEQLERMEKQRKDDRSRQEDPEQARLKQKAKEMQQQELAQMRQRDANLTALAAIGPRKKRKVDSPGATPSGTEVPGSAAGSPASSSVPSTSSRQYTRQRITRVNLRDLIFYMEQERETTHSLLLYRALLK
uniref:TAFH domain-containing protein n=1 Tax=Cynoglossus semilaevis TaxID=244447 RepID=A0A3P8VYZ9_CYNSE